MTIRNKTKDHLRKHGGIELVPLTVSRTGDDPLRFWTNHPTENAVVDLHVFAEGESKNPSSYGGGKWSGPFSGRPELIVELAPALQARVTLAAKATCSSFTHALRAFWRMLDQLEATPTPDGKTVERLISVKNLTHLHEAAAHRARVRNRDFACFLGLANDARQLMRLRPLAWTIPKVAESNRKLIPDDQAKEIKIGIKRDWERVRKNWERNDAIILDKKPDPLTEFEKQDAAAVLKYANQNEVLRRNWLHFEHIQKSTGRILPSMKQLFADQAERDKFNSQKGVNATTMRSIVFPTRHECDVAFHSALMGSGWNPSTLITGIDATMPDRIFQHPKDQKQNVLMIDMAEGIAKDKPEDTEITMQGSKRRAGGRLQFCMGLKKNPDAPPVVVAKYLERTTKLREQLRQDVQNAYTAFEKLKADGAPREAVERQLNRHQTLQQGLRNVWLYLDNHGEINWLDGKSWSRNAPVEATGKRVTQSYLDLVIKRLNVQRKAHRETLIPKIVPSDFRDIYARWVLMQTGGNVIAVMLALGHSRLNSTNRYLDNNVFNAENDDMVRRFMSNLFDELEQGRVDLTILAQLVRHGPLTLEMQDRLVEYRNLMRSRIKTGCADPKNPPTHISPEHEGGKWCGTQRCLRDCPNARFLPESLDGISMRIEELLVMSDQLPLDTWTRGDFEKELESGQYLLSNLYPKDAVEKARAYWSEKIREGKHVVPGVGIIHEQETA